MTETTTKPNKASKPSLFWDVFWHWIISLVALIAFGVAFEFIFSRDKAPAPQAKTAPSLKECRSSFDEILMGFNGTQITEMASRCTNEFNSFIAELKTNYRVQGAALIVGNDAYSLQGVKVGRYDRTISDGVLLPSVRVSSGRHGFTAVLRFATAAEANVAYSKIVKGMAENPAAIPLTHAPIQSGV